MSSEWVDRVFWGAVPVLRVERVWEWAQRNVRLVGSARSEAFDVSVTPWLREPFERINDGRTRRLTLVLPVQSGKSALGEVAICYWIATASGGDIQYNWENDVKGLDRYKKRVRKILQACGPVAQRWPSNRSDEGKGLVVFPHLNFTMQGVWAESNLESDSICFQVNEEVHDWEAGRLSLADKRQRAVWNAFQINISTGGKYGDQLHQRLEDSSKRRWLEKCPECGEWQAFHCKKDKGKLGGLCYDADGCRREDGSYDYEALAKTVFYECEHCGHHMQDDYAERKQRSLEGKWEERDVENPNQGFTMQGVSIYWIPWIDIIREKHMALASMKMGDLQPWINYVQRIEAGFWDARDRPHAERVTVVEGVSKRDGLEGRAFRGMTVDYQGGRAKWNQSPHFKLVLRDWEHSLKSQLVFEGKALTGEEVEDIRKHFGVAPEHVLIDSGYRARDIYQLCARYDWAAIKGDEKMLFSHELPDGVKVRRIYSPMQPVDPFLGDPEGREGKVNVPLIFYSKQGIRDVLDMIRAQHEWIVPADVSEEYLKEMSAEEERTFHHPKTGEAFTIWCKIIEDAPNDYFVCECYQALLATILIDAGYLDSIESLSAAAKARPVTKVGG